MLCRGGNLKMGALKPSKNSTHKLSIIKMVANRDFSKFSLDSKGSINKSFYSRDDLHLSAAGYLIWFKKLKPILREYELNIPYSEFWGQVTF